MTVAVGIPLPAPGIKECDIHRMCAARNVRPPRRRSGAVEVAETRGLTAKLNAKIHVVQLSGVVIQVNVHAPGVDGLAAVQLDGLRLDVEVRQHVDVVSGVRGARRLCREYISRTASVRCVV